MVSIVLSGSFVVEEGVTGIFEGSKQTFFATCLEHSS